MPNSSEKESFLNDNPHLTDFMSMLEEVQKESERGSVLVTCSMLDDLLRKIISSFLLKGKEANDLIEGFNAPLGTFSARIKCAHAMGLITKKEFSECNILRKIRNEFAHNINISFEEQSIIDLCKNLQLRAKDYEGVHVNPHGQYATASTALILNLTNRAHYVSKERLKLKNWPY